MLFIVALAITVVRQLAEVPGDSRGKPWRYSKNHLFSTQLSRHRATIELLAVVPPNPL
jgi:hypothetical protein